MPSVTLEYITAAEFVMRKKDLHATADGIDKLEMAIGLFGSLFEGSGTGMVIFDSSGNILRTNSVFSLMSGYERQELEGKHFLDFILPGEISRARSQFEKLLSGQLNYVHAERRYLRKDGSIIDIILTISVYHGNNGKPLFMVAMAEDVTERKRSEMLQQIIYNISSAVNSTKDLRELIGFIQHELGRLIDTSNFYIALYDRENDSLSLPFFADDQDNFEVFPAGKTLSSYVIRTARPVLLREADMNMLEEEGEVELIGSSSKIWMGVPLKIKNDIIGLIGIQSYHDENAYTQADLGMLEFVSSQITLLIERKRNEQDLVLERAFFKQIFENSPEAIVIGDRKGNIININKGFTDLFGFGTEECLGRNINELITPAEFEEESVRLRELIACDELYFIDTVRKKKDGSLVDVSILGSPFGVEDKKLTCVIYRDITEQKKTEETLKQAKERAEESDRLKTAFLANMSHEIRTPMNAIIGFTELLSVPGLPENDKNDYISVIKSSGNILLKLIDDIIDLAKIEADQIRIEAGSFSVNQLMNEVVSYYNEEIMSLRRKNIELIFEPGETDQFIISSDPFRIKQILGNLIGNAIKFTEKGNIKTGYSRFGRDKLRFYVQDTGIGIPEDKHSLIFNRFLQVDNERTRKFGGTGLGLAISKKLVELLGGEIWLESVPLKGSVFYFTILLQYAEEPSEQSGTVENEYREKSLSGKTLLVVEDNEVNYQLIREILRHSQARILWVHTGEEAIQMLKKDPSIDMVLMDIQLPGINGFEATHAILEIQPEMPVVAQTAYAMSGEREKALEAGCVDYIAKPIKPAELISLVNKHISRPSSSN